MKVTMLFVAVLMALIMSGCAPMMELGHQPPSVQMGEEISPLELPPAFQPAPNFNGYRRVI